MKNWICVSLFVTLVTTVSAQEQVSTCQDAAKATLDFLTEPQRAELAALSADELIDLHFNLGIRVREVFGLWNGNHALRADCSSVALTKHPDDVSLVIIGLAWERLRTAP
ncbi:MAG: DUF6794 domain-containing protein [Pseudomonadota bacterium]